MTRPTTADLDRPPRTAPRSERRKRPSRLRRLTPWLAVLMLIVPATVIGPRLVAQANHPYPDPPTACAPNRTAGLPCLTLRTVRGDGQVLVLMGFVGLPGGRPLTGASIELVGNTKGSGLQATGLRAISDGNGNFAFAVLNPVAFYAARLVGNDVYPASASPVVGR